MSARRHRRALAALVLAAGLLAPDGPAPAASTAPRGQPPPTVRPLPRGTAVATRHVDSTDPALAAEAERLTREMQARIAAHLGWDISIPIAPLLLDERPVTVLPDGTIEEDNGWALPYAGDVPAPWSLADRCVIGLWAGAVNDPGGLPALVAHEVFHCFQFAMAGDVDTVLRSEEWIIEGQATWVEAALTGANSSIAADYYDWFCNAVPLTSRSYDAAGFFTVLDELGVSPWTIFADMIALRGAAAIDATGIDSTTMLRRIATTAMRDSPSAPRFGPDWRTDPIGGGDDVCRVTVAVPEGREWIGEGPLGRFDRGEPIEVVAVEGEVLSWHLTAPIGMHELRNGISEQWVGYAFGMHCLQERCVCPDGEREIRSQGELPMAIAFTSDRDAQVSARLRSLTVAEACEPQLDDVVVEVYGELDQTFYGGYCIIRHNSLQVSAGWTTSGGYQDEPYPDGDVLVLPGHNHSAVFVLRESVSGFVHGDQSGTAYPGATELEGFVIGDRLQVRFQCPRIQLHELTPSQQAQLADEVNRLYPEEAYRPPDLWLPDP